MALADYLTVSSVSANLEVSSKQEALEALLALLADSCPELDIKKALTVIYKREAMGSTGIGDGVAIPHGTVNGCPRIQATIARSTAGCDFDAVDGKKCHIFCLLIVPEAASAGHLSVLAKFARMFKAKEFQNRFMEAADDADLYRVLQMFWRD